MFATLWRALSVVPVALAVVALAGCIADDPPALTSAQTSAPPKEPTTKQVEATRKAIGKNVEFEIMGERRRVLINAQVCLREGQLEGLLCRKGTKEHEYIVSADCDARHIHAALIAARAKSGSVVQFEPKYAAPTGAKIKVYLQYEQDGKLKTVPAQEWIRTKDKKNLDIDWVFAGSQFVRDPSDKNKPDIYLANYGDLICVCNMDSAMLDLPIKSPKSFDDRVFNAHTDRIPPMETKVTVILEPVLEKEK